MIVKARDLRTAATAGTASGGSAGLASVAEGVAKRSGCAPAGRASVPRPNPMDCDVGSRPIADQRSQRDRCLAEAQRRDCCQVDVVRCKDCKHCFDLADTEPLTPYQGGGNGFYCEAWAMDLSAPEYSAETFYCADGKRRAAEAAVKTMDREKVLEELKVIRTWAKCRTITPSDFNLIVTALDGAIGLLEERKG